MDCDCDVIVVVMQGYEGSDWCTVVVPRLWSLEQGQLSHEQPWGTLNNRGCANKRDCIIYNNNQQPFFWSLTTGRVITSQSQWGWKCLGKILKLGDCVQDGPFSCTDRLFNCFCIFHTCSCISCSDCKRFTYIAMISLWSCSDWKWILIAMCLFL